MSYSLDLIKLEEVYKKTVRRSDLVFVDKGKEYTTAVINVTFKYVVKEYNRISKHKSGSMIYIKFGHKYMPERFKDNVWIENGELIGIKTEAEVKYPLPQHILGKYFRYVNGRYKQQREFKTLMTTKELRQWAYDKGFICDGIQYLRYKRSPGSSRVGKCLFINEKMQARMIRWSLNGIRLRKGQKVDLAAIESDMSLTLSSIIDIVQLKPENILLISDYQDVFHEEAVVTEIDGDHLFSQEKEAEIKNDIWDGQSLLDTSVFNESGYGDKGMLLLRNRFFKSCCFNTNLQSFFKEQNITNISQLNGYTRATRIEDIKIVTTPNSIKYLKFGSFDKWLDNLDPSFGIVKFEKPTHFHEGRLVQTHYQLLNTLQISSEEVEEFLAPQISYIENIKSDPAFMRLALKYKEPNYYSKDILSNANIAFLLMGINNDFCYTRWYKEFRANIVRKMIKAVKSGKVLVEGNYSTLFGNPVEMLYESIGKFDGTSTIDKGTIYCKRFAHGERLLGSRSPHVTMGNILLATNNRVEAIDKYFNLTTEIVCVNSIGESLLDRLSGADFDSDTMLLTNNPILVSAAEKNYSTFKVPVNLVHSMKLKREYCSREQADLDDKTSVNKIGEVINMSQILNSILWDKINKGATYDEVRDIYYDICQLDVLSNLEIDKAKKEYKIDTVVELRRIKKKYESYKVKNKQFKPYFFSHIAREKNYYDKTRNAYCDCETTMDYISHRMNHVHIKTECPEQTKSFSSCLNMDDFDIRRVQYYQVYKVINSVHDTSIATRKIWQGSMSPEQKYREARERKEQCTKEIGSIKYNTHTMRWLLASVDKDEYASIRTSLLSSLFAMNNPGFIEVLKHSEEILPYLQEDTDGDIDIFGKKYIRLPG